MAPGSDTGAGRRGLV